MDNEVDNVVLSIQHGEGTSTTDYGGDEVPNDCNEDDKLMSMWMTCRYIFIDCFL